MLLTKKTKKVWNESVKRKKKKDLELLWSTIWFWLFLYSTPTGKQTDTERDTHTQTGLSFKLTAEINCWDCYQRDDDSRPHQPPQHLAAALWKVTQKLQKHTLKSRNRSRRCGLSLCTLYIYPDSELHSVQWVMPDLHLMSFLYFRTFCHYLSCW